MFYALAAPCSDLIEKGVHLAVYSNMPGVQRRANATMTSRITYIEPGDRYTVANGLWTVQYEVNLRANHDMEGGKSPPWIRWRYGDALHATKKEPDFEARAAAGAETAKRSNKGWSNLKIGGALPPHLVAARTNQRQQKRQRTEARLAEERQSIDAKSKEAQEQSGYSLRPR